MAWIESHQELARHPKTRRLARLLDESVPAVIGRLHLLWWWALDYADDGDLTNYDDADIADALMWDGEPSALVVGLVRAGFMDEDRQIHDWTEYVGRLLEQRQLRNQRVVRNRQLYADMTVVHEVRDRDGDECRYCGRAVDWADRKGSKGGTYDHVDPEGPNTADNVVVACRGCNSAKGRRNPEQAGMPLLPGRKSTRNLPEKQPNGRFNSTVPNRTGPNQPDRTGGTRAAGAAPPVQAAPKPNRQAEVIDAVRAQGAPLEFTTVDGTAVKKCSATPADIAAAYAAAYRGEWDPGGDGWLRENLSVHAVISRLAGYYASRNGAPARASPRGRGSISTQNGSLRDYVEDALRRGEPVEAEVLAKVGLAP